MAEKPTLLIVDDEQGVLKMARLVLERNGYRIAVAKDGIEGVAWFARHVDEVAVVLTDVHMPNFDGISLVQAVRKLKPGVPIIGSTGHSTDDEEQRLKDLGADRFLKKPYTKRQLLMPIMELFDAPATTESCAARLESVVPTQALVLMNDEFVEEQAGYLAGRALEGCGDDPAKSTSISSRPTVTLTLIRTRSGALPSESR